MSKDPKEYLRHIQDECQFLVSVTNNLTYSNFIQDEILKRAVVRSLEIIVRQQKIYRLILKLNGL